MTLRRARALLLALTVSVAGCSSCQQATDPLGGAGADATTSSTTSSGQIRPGVIPPADPGLAQGGRLELPTVGKGAEFPTPDPAAAPPEPLVAEDPIPALEEQLFADQQAGIGDCIAIIDASPDFGQPPLTVNFSVEAQCSGGAPSYTWDFGDGAPPSSDPAPVHVYDRAGEYTVTLQVIGPDGSKAADDLDITVEESFLPEQ